MFTDQTQSESPPSAAGAGAAYKPCEQCGAPLDQQQRYCLTCGTRRKHAADPAARFLAGASRRQKPAPGTVASTRGGSISVFTLGAILLIPLALGLGVLVGRGSSNPDAKLISALRSERAAGGSVASGGSVGSGGSSSASTTASAGTGSSGSGATAAKLIVGNWTRSSGYAIELSSLPKGTGSSAAARAEQTDRSKGAKAVGVLNASAYHITPAPSGTYVIYSGSYATSAAASKALAGLKKDFPSAQVIHVMIPSASSNTPVVSHTSYGTAHQVVGYKPSASDLAKGAQVANEDAHSTGKTASGAGLPDVVSVP